MKTKLIFTAAALICACLHAEILMPKIFSDGMVLQRAESVKIWGKADKGAKVDVEFAGQKKSATADENGKWSVNLNALPANASASVMKVFENGKEAKSIADVLVGEVWVTGGQSNMQFGMRNSTDFEAAKKRCLNYKTLRMFKQIKTDLGTETPQFDFPYECKWIAASSGEIDGWSAAAYYFGEKLLAELKVPVGLLDSSLGGSSMITWVPESVAKAEPNFAAALKKFNDEKKVYDHKAALADYKERKRKYDAEVKKAAAEGKPAPAAPSSDLRYGFAPTALGPGNIRNMPCYLYNSKIAPMAGYTARGIIWYQGEANSGQLDGKFESMFKALIGAWRDAWGKPEMPFIFAQLPSFKQTSWPEARWEQYNTSKALKNVGVTVLIDLGEENDIHPKNKTDVGLRMAGIALKDVYGLNVTHPYGPMFKNAKFDGASATVTFENGGRKMLVKGELRGFEVCVNGKWVGAKAEGVGNDSFKISSADGAAIEGVRYLWKPWAQPDVCIFNEDGLPAMSFKAYSSKK